MIADHEVTNEKPKDNLESTIEWKKEEGIKAFVHDRNKIYNDKQYSSDLTFELRIEP